MRALNALPLSSCHHHVMALDPDTGDAYDFNTLEHAPDEGAVWVRVGLL